MMNFGKAAALSAGFIGAVALGVAIAGEPLTASIIVAAIVIAAGVALVLSARHAPTGDRQHGPAWRPLREAVGER